MDNPKFFNTPFATTGDKTAIPDDIQPSGALSYMEGYGYDYERNPATDPQAKRIERDKMNQLHYDITQNIQQYQLYGTPFFYNSENNDGVNVHYPKGAMVRYDDGNGENIYCSLIDNNTATPLDTKKWALANNTLYAMQDGSRNFAEISISNTEIIATLNPAPKALTAGMEICFVVNESNSEAPTLNLNGFGAKNIVYHETATPILANSFKIGDIVRLLFDGENWRLPPSGEFLNGRYALKKDDFKALFAQNGYQILPSGLILQWGYLYNVSATNNSFSFPIAFSNICFSVFLSDLTQTFDKASVSDFGVLAPATGFINSATFSVVVSGSFVADSCFFLAIGY